MDHFMCQRILYMALISHLICTYQYTVLWIKTTCFPVRTTPAIYVVTREIASELSNIVAQETNYWTFTYPMEVSSHQISSKIRQKARTHCIAIDSLVGPHTVCNLQLQIGYLAQFGIVPSPCRSSSPSTWNKYCGILTRRHLQECIQYH